MQDIIGISDGIIVSIQQITPILRFCLTPAIRLEVSETTGITLLIIEVRTIGMKNHEEFAITVMVMGRRGSISQWQYLIQFLQQILIIMVALRSILFLQKIMLISLFSQKIDKRMIGQLVADKHSMESGFLKGRQDAFLMKKSLKILG